MEEELKKILSDNLVLTLTDEENEDYEQGVIDKSFLKKHVSDFNQNFYVCGPEKMVKDISKVLEDLGAKPSKIVFEK